MALWRLSIVVSGWAALTSMGPPDQEVAQAKESHWLWSIGIVAATVVMPWLLPACGLEFMGDNGHFRREVELLGIYGQLCICVFGVMWLGALWTTPPTESDS